MPSGAVLTCLGVGRSPLVLVWGGRPRPPRRVARTFLPAKPSGASGLLRYEPRKARNMFHVEQFSGASSHVATAALGWRAGQSPAISCWQNAMATRRQEMSVPHENTVPRGTLLGILDRTVGNPRAYTPLRRAMPGNNGVNIRPVHEDVILKPRASTRGAMDLGRARH